MSSFARRILSTFVELDEPEQKNSAPSPADVKAADAVTSTSTVVFASDKFKIYFENLFRDSNLPGPDYYEFTRMTEAMNAIPDEKTRFVSAYAGLSLQGLDKDKLIKTAHQYLDLIDGDARNFNSTVEKAMQEKVTGKKKEMEDKAKRIQDLTREISELSQKLDAIKSEIQDNEQKIQANASTYTHESDTLKNKINQDIQKINQYIS